MKQLSAHQSKLSHLKSHGLIEVGGNANNPNDKEHADLIILKSGKVIKISRFYVSFYNSMEDYQCTAELWKMPTEAEELEEQRAEMMLCAFDGHSIRKQIDAIKEYSAEHGIHELLDNVDGVMVVEHCEYRYSVGGFLEEITL